MTGFFGGVATILGLELRQRVRGVAWYVLIGIFVVLVALVTAVLFFAMNAFSSEVDHTAGAAIYSTIIYFVLLLGTLVAPALSGNAINGDRDAGTLATTQVTLITTGQLVVGKFLAAWITALAFLVASIPFILFSTVAGGLALDTFVVSILLLAFELGVVAAIGVGLSGLLNRPLFSVVVTYLAVAALSIGTLITFALGAIAVQSETTYTYTQGITYDDATGRALTCTTPEISHSTVPRYDYFWGVLAANPYVVLADATPTHFNADGNPDDLFGSIKSGVRMAQIAPDLQHNSDECSPEYYSNSDYKTPQQTIDETVPSWFVGVLVHLVLAGAALTGAWAKLRTPARKLGKGSRIA